MNSLAKLFLPLALSISLSAQYHPGGRALSGTGNGIGPVIDAVASFDDVFKSADKKFIEIQVDSGDIMRMYITGKTKFIRDGKAAKREDFHDGDKIVADATRDARLNLLAVRIENKKPEEKKEEEKKPDK
jgi:hypothetical protein